MMDAMKIVSGHEPRRPARQARVARIGPGIERGSVMRRIVEKGQHEKPRDNRCGKERPPFAPGIDTGSNQQYDYRDVGANA